MEDNRYAQVVDEGRRLMVAEGRTRLRLGDLANEAMLLGHGVAGFAHAIGADEWFISQFADVARCWPEDKRPAVSWSVLYEARNVGERFSIVHDGMTVDQLRLALGKVGSHGRDYVYTPRPVADKIKSGQGSVWSHEYDWTHLTAEQQAEQREAVVNSIDHVIGELTRFKAVVMTGAEVDTEIASLA